MAYDPDGVIVRIEVTNLPTPGKRLQLSTMAPQVDLEGMRPMSADEAFYMKAGTAGLWGSTELAERGERRKRFIDMLAHSIAFDITEALFKREG